MEVVPLDVVEELEVGVEVCDALVLFMVGVGGLFVGVVLGVEGAHVVLVDDGALLCCERGPSVKVVGFGEAADGARDVVHAGAWGPQRARMSRGRMGWRHVAHVAGQR